MANDMHRPGIKRAATEQAERASSKRPCIEDTNAMEKLLELVRVGMAKNTHITEKSRRMLCSMIPDCLGTPSDERHEFQIGVADMIRSALANAEAHRLLRLLLGSRYSWCLRFPLLPPTNAHQLWLSTAAAALTSSVHSERAGAGPSTRDVSVAKEIERANTEAVEASEQHAKTSAEQGVIKTTAQSVADAFEKAKAQWKKDNASLRSIAKKLDFVKDVQVRCDAGLRESQEQKRAVEAALQDHIVALMDSSAKEAGQQHLEALVQVVKREGIEDGLANSFPIAAKKKPNSRTSWDNRVLSQLKAELTKRGRKLDEAIASALPPAQERAQAVAAQGVLLLNVRKQMAATAHALRSAELDVRDAEAAVYDSEVAEFEAAAAEDAKREQQKAAAEALEGFRRGPLAAFETLKTRRSAAGTAAVAPAGA